MTTQDGTFATIDEDRRPALYGTLVTCLVLNNLAVASRVTVNYLSHYRKRDRIFLEDVFVLLSGVCVNVIIGNLLASTHYGLGLHSARINAEDPYMPRNMSNIFKHVWICMVFVGPTFTFIKLSLLFFYRRLFIVNQKWLRIAWWGNLVYIILWFFGATGFYIFQCWPVQWYWMRYYQRYHFRPSPIVNKGQCNATTVQHVAMPLIFSLISDVALLLLPIAAILKLHISSKRKLGLATVFSVGALACLLELARIIDLEVQTDDKSDPSYGVVVFLILSVAEEVCAIICASLPVVIPHLVRDYRSKRSSHKTDSSYSKGCTALPRPGSSVGGFQKLGGGSGDQACDGRNLSGEQDWASGSIQLNHVVAESRPQAQRLGGDQIIVTKAYDVTVQGSDAYVV